jgi:hypothetical protein
VPDDDNTEAMRRLAREDQQAAQSETARRDEEAWALNRANATAAAAATFAKADRDKAVALLLNCLAFLLVVAIFAGVITLIVQAI